MLTMRIHKVVLYLELNRNNSDILSVGYNGFITELEDIISGKRGQRKWGNKILFTQQIRSAKQRIILLAPKCHMADRQDLQTKPFPSWHDLFVSNYNGYYYGEVTITPLKAIAVYTDHHAYIVRVMQLLDKWKLNWIIGGLEIAFDTEDEHEFCDLWLPLLPKNLRVKDAAVFHCKNGRGSKPVHEATRYGLGQYIRGDFTTDKKKPLLQYVGYDRRPFGHDVYRVECKLGKRGTKRLGITNPFDVISKRELYPSIILNQFYLLDYHKLLDEMPQAKSWIPEIANTVVTWQLKYLMEKTGLTRPKLIKFFVKDHPTLILDAQTEWGMADSLVRVDTT